MDFDLRLSTPGSVPNSVVQQIEVLRKKRYLRI